MFGRRGGGCPPVSSRLKKGTAMTTYTNAEVNVVFGDEGGWRYGEADDGTEVRSWLGDVNGWTPVPADDPFQARRMWEHTNFSYNAG